MQPEVSPCLHRRLRLIPIPSHQQPRILRPHRQLTDVTDRHLLVVVVDQSHLEPVADHPATGTVVGQVVEPGRNLALYVARTKRRAHLGGGEVGGDPKPKTFFELMKLWYHGRQMHFVEWCIRVFRVVRLIEEEVGHDI